MLQDRPCVYTFCPLPHMCNTNSLGIRYHLVTLPRLHKLHVLVVVGCSLTGGHIGIKDIKNSRNSLKTIYEQTTFFSVCVQCMLYFVCGDIIGLWDCNHRCTVAFSFSIMYLSRSAPLLLCQLVGQNCWPAAHEGTNQPCHRALTYLSHRGDWSIGSNRNTWHVTGLTDITVVSQVCIWDASTSASSS